MSRIPDTHAEAWSLLPWLATGRVQPADREWLDAHVAGCAECRAELHTQRMIAAPMRAAGEAPAASAADEQRSFDKLMARIDAADGATAMMGTPREAAPLRTSRAVRWLVAAVVVQGFGLALLGFNTLRSAPTGEFRTVSSVDTPRLDAPTLRIVFAPEATISSVNTLLAHQGLTLVSGPGLSGNFTAMLSADAVASGATAESVAAVISRDPNVTFAQPVAR
jgi:hypothetical protein